MPRPAKRARRSASEHQEEQADPEAPSSRHCPLELSLFVRWWSPTDKTKVTHLFLRPVDGLDSLKGVAKTLLAREYQDQVQPRYIASDEFYQFTPTEEMLSIPGDIARTEVRLVVAHGGWEYTVMKQDLTVDQGSDRDMVVTPIEFESTAMLMGNLGLRMAMIAYPMISIRKSWLLALEQRLKDDGEGFKGIA